MSSVVNVIRIVPVLIFKNIQKPFCIRDNWWRYAFSPLLSAPPNIVLESGPACLSAVKKTIRIVPVLKYNYTETILYKRQLVGVCILSPP